MRSGSYLRVSCRHNYRLNRCIAVNRDIALRTYAIRSGYLVNVKTVILSNTIVNRNSVINTRTLIAGNDVVPPRDLILNSPTGIIGALNTSIRRRGQRRTLICIRLTGRCNTQE